MVTVVEGGSDLWWLVGEDGATVGIFASLRWALRAAADLFAFGGFAIGDGIPGGVA